MKVYVLIINHRHGNNVSIHATDVDANEAVAAYCEEYWAHEMRGRHSGETQPIPTEPSELIASYFEQVDDEGWSVEECDLPAELCAA